MDPAAALEMLTLHRDSVLYILNASLESPCVVYFPDCFLRSISRIQRRKEINYSSNNSNFSFHILVRYREVCISGTSRRAIAHGDKEFLISHDARFQQNKITELAYIT